MSLFWLQSQAYASATQVATPGVPTLTYASAVMSLVPTAYWRLGEASGDLADSSGNSHTLTAAGLTYGTAGWTTDGNNAATWAGSGSYATVADHADFDPGTADWSVVLVLKRNGAPADVEDLICHDLQGYSGAWGLRIASTTNLMVVECGNLYNLWHTASSTIFDNGYHHIAVTADRSNVATMYFDGSSVGTVDISSDVSTDLTNTQSLWLGATGATSENFTGTLDEVAFWKNRLLSSSEVLQLYNAR